MNPPNLQQKIRRGLALVFLSTMGSRGIAFAADIGLMRLLAVETFGVMAFGLLVVNSLNLVRSMGIGEALIFRREADQQSCDTGFVIALILGVGLYGGTYVAAPWIALLAENGDRELVVSIVRWLGTLVLLQGIASVPGALLERELAFEKRFFVDTLPTLIYALLGLGLAFGGYGIWSLVWGRLIGAGVGAVAAWGFSPWRPRWQFSWKKAREVGGYGRFVAGAALVSFLVVNVDDALVVKLAGVTTLGFYARAYLLANLPVTSVTHIVSRVAFPAYARLRGQDGAVQELYSRLVGVVLLVSLPIACGLVLLARPFVLGVFGDKWMPLVPLLPWLGIYGLLRALLSNTGPLFNAMGEPQAILKTNTVQSLLLLAGLFPLIQWRGAEGACIGILMGTLLSAPLALRYMHRVAGLGLDAQLVVLRPLLLPAAGMALVMFLVRSGWDACGADWPLGQLLVAGCCGMLAYGGLLYYRERVLLAQALDLLRGK